MSLLNKVVDFVGGSMFKEIKEGVVSYFPPDMSQQQKAEFELKLERLLIEKQANANELLRQSANQLDKRINEQEGLANELKSVPFVGMIVILLRGIQRPFWVFATLVLDYKWFFDELTLNDTQQTTLIIINSLVLGFMFGERAVQNLVPALASAFTRRK